jgi:hypothetical protein
MQQRTDMRVWCLPGVERLKVQTSDHDTFKAEVEQVIPWRERRWDKTVNEGWLLWIDPEHLPVLRRLAYWFDRAWFYDEVAGQGEDLQSQRTWTLKPPAEQLTLFS